MQSGNEEKLYATATLLAIITVGYNLVEGGFSVAFGAADETLSLFGFGVDSFVEVLSGIGIWHMLRRIRRHRDASRDKFEAQALRVTGWAFYLLAVGMVISAGLSLYRQHQPESTFWGIVISLVSLTFMWLLIHYKEKVGHALSSPAILADAACSRACLYLSLALLVSSGGYALTGTGIFDVGGAVVIGLFALREGREAFRKAEGGTCCCQGKCGS